MRLLYILSASPFLRETPLLVIKLYINHRTFKKSMLGLGSSPPAMRWGFPCRFLDQKDPKVQCNFWLLLHEEIKKGPQESVHLLWMISSYGFTISCTKGPLQSPVCEMALSEKVAVFSLHMFCVGGNVKFIHQMKRHFT